jgi:hypothetical protein
MRFTCYAKFPQGGCPNIWQKSISATSSTSAPVFWSGKIVKVITFLVVSSLVMKLDSPLWTRNQTAEHVMEAHVFSFVQIFKTQPAVGRLLLTVFWDSYGPLLEHYMERCITVKSASYCDMLRNKLRPAIPSKRRSLSQSVVLLHDALLTISTI